MEKKIRMLTAKKFAQEMAVDYSTVVRWLKFDLVPNAKLQESPERGKWWEIPETSLTMERPRPGPVAKKTVAKPAAKLTKKVGSKKAAKK